MDTGNERPTTMKSFTSTATAMLFLLLLPNVMESQTAKDSSVGGGALTKVADIPMPGPAVRFDYQSLDADHGRLYIAHMNADQLVVFDTEKRQVVANLDAASTGCRSG
jgi:hypothetical protein